MSPPPAHKPPAPSGKPPASPPKPATSGKAAPTTAGKAPVPARPAAPPSRRVLVFGPTGRVGSLFVDGALKRGHQVSVYTRNAQSVRVKHKNLRICGGNISDDGAIREAVKGQDVVVVALGARDISKAHSVCSDAIKRIVGAMQQFGVERVVMVGNVGLLPHPSGRLAGEAGLPPFLEFVFVDQRTAWEHLRDSPLDWVMLCPGFMPKGAFTGKYRVAVESVIDRAQAITVEDVAHFLLKEVFDEPHHRVRIALAT